jgi:hypothetical protein
MSSSIGKIEGLDIGLVPDASNPLAAPHELSNLAADNAGCTKVE